MNDPPLCWDLPTPFVDMAMMASRLNASLTIYDQNDRLVYANHSVRRIYYFFDFDSPQTFDAMLRRSWEHGESVGIPAPQDPDEAIMFTNLRRQGERLEFIRRYPTNLICGHVRLPDGRNAQLRVEPARAGLQHYFAADTPTLGLIEAIRSRDEAEQKAAALDCLAFGVAVVGPDCKPLHMNAAMMEIIDHGDGLHLDDLGRLAAMNPEDSAGVARLIALACIDKLPAPTVAISVRGSGPGRVHTLSVSRGADASGSAVLIVAPARLDVAAVSTVLRRDYGLTSAEAGLAAHIGNGLTNDDVAKELGKSQGTGRHHIKSILKKLDRGELANRGQTGLARWVAILGAITGAARTRGK